MAPMPDEPPPPDPRSVPFDRDVLDGHIVQYQQLHRRIAAMAEEAKDDESAFARLYPAEDLDAANALIGVLLRRIQLLELSANAAKLGALINQDWMGQSVGELRTQAELMGTVLTRLDALEAR